MSRNPPLATAPSSSVLAPDPLACAGALLDVVPAAMDALRAAMRRHVGQQLSVPQFRCLAFVSREPGASIGAVAAFLGVSMPTASAMVDRLVRAGAVAPGADPADRRRQRLHITPAGRAQLRRIRADTQQELAGSLAARPPAALAALMGGLHEMQQCFDPAHALAPVAPAPSTAPTTAPAPAAAPPRQRARKAAAGAPPAVAPGDAAAPSSLPPTRSTP